MIQDGVGDNKSECAVGSNDIMETIRRNGVEAYWNDDVYVGSKYTDKPDEVKEVNVKASE